ncbi:MAG: YbaB/EbfC family nucleoid-associated protein [Calditrichaeota bacterium]|nr:MAG: YbaB/EbfC family nucleoid-associated protein [Calditrichota bacterium]MBL1207755.1 YbaB/EbfC family nucleoid-associated protein [Calditrichota bacterium]NOG47589.1 YbaB/EbfC family nucleoid-associated protein [Calditrichota bacterium]
MNMNNLLKQAQKMQADMAKAQDELANITVQGSSGGGMVTVEANCKLEILSIKIEKEVVDPEDKEMLEDLIAAAVNQTIQTAQQKAQEEMQKITGGMLGGMNLPGNLNIPGM